MRLRFNPSGQLLEIISSDKLELEQLRLLATAPMYAWKDKKFVHVKDVCHLYDWRWLPAGLWCRIFKLRDIGYDVNIEGVDRLVNVNIKKDVIERAIDARTDIKYSLLPHQLDAVYYCLKYRHCSASVGTGGGKTFITFVLATLLQQAYKFDTNKKLLVVVPSQLLCIQGFNDFEDYDLKDNKDLKTYQVYSGAKNKYTLAESHVVFGTFQSLINWPEDMFAQFADFFIDEGHKAPAASIMDIVKRLMHTRHRWALSGSLPKDANSLALLDIETYIGAKVYECKTAKLRDAGVVADFKIMPLKIVHSPEMTMQYYLGLKNAKDHLRYEQEYLFNNKTRLDAIAKVVAKLPSNTLVLAKRVDEVVGLHEACNRLDNKQVHLIVGGVSNDDKSRIVKHIDDDLTHNNVIVGNSDMIGTGISIKALFYAVFSGIGKSYYASVQTIGRLIRLHELKDKAIIIDIQDDLRTNLPDSVVPYHKRQSYSIKHANTRLYTYADEDYEVDYSKNLEIHI